MLPAEPLKLSFARLLAFVGHDERGRFLADELLLHADHCRLDNVGMPRNDLFDLDWTDAMAADLQDLFRTTLMVEEPVVVPAGEVAGPEPSIVQATPGIAIPIEPCLSTARAGGK